MARLRGARCAAARSPPAPRRERERLSPISRRARGGAPEKREQS